MKVDSLEELGAAFTEWRTNKKHAREVMPEELVDRARRAVGVHGEGCVARAAQIDRERLRGTRGPARKMRPAGLAEAPRYSRVELVPPAGGSRLPFAELELPSGAKVRLYSQGPQTMELLSSVCGIGGGR